MIIKRILEEKIEKNLFKGSMSTLPESVFPNLDNFLPRCII